MSKKKRIIINCIILFFIFAWIGVLILQGNIRITSFFASKYVLNGIDVSHYQGNIDWEKIEEQGIDFAFIKATEGSSHVDQYFEENWDKAGQTSLMLGAYHFFSFDSEGKFQAEHFIDTVGNLQGKLAPVIDVEYYGDKKADPPLKKDVQAQLSVMLDLLEEHYHIKPIIYTTYKAYHDFIKGEFEGYPLWIRNVYYPPAAMEWTFWQYTDQAVLDGYQGSEKYIDRNVFRGSREDLESLVVPFWTEKSGETADMKIPGSEGGTNELQAPECFTVREKDGTNRTISLSHCNLEYEEEEIQVYSYLGLECSLYILTPETEKVIYPIADFLVDSKRGLIWILEKGTAPQISRLELGDKNIEQRKIAEYEDFASAFVDRYGMTARKDGISFYDMNVWFSQSKKEYEADNVLEGMAHCVFYETGERYYLAFAVDVQNGEVHWFGKESFFEVSPENESSSLSMEEVFSMVEKGDFSFVDMSAIRETSGDTATSREELVNAFEAGDEIEFIRCDVNWDGAEELIWQVKNEYQPEGMVQYIFGYQNGWAIGIYYDGWDGNEWLTLGESGKLYYNLVITAPYSVEAFYACSLDAAGYKEIEYGLEIISISDKDGLDGLRRNYPDLVEKYPEMAKEGVYYIKVRPKTVEEINQLGSALGRVEEMITEEEFKKEYHNLTGRQLTGKYRV